MRVVAEDDNLEAAGEEGLVEHGLLDQVVQRLVLALLPVQDFLQELVVQRHSHPEPGLGEGVGLQLL